MDARMKRLLIGFGIMFGMQFLAAYLGLKTGGNNPESTFYIMLGFTLAAYFGGGLVMGLLSDRIIVLEPAFAALISVAANASLAALSTKSTGELGIADVLFTSYAIQKMAVGSLLLAVGAVVAAALVGALVGERIAIPTYDWISSAATLFGLICLVIGPIFLLSRTGTERGLPGIPAPFMIIIVLLFLVVVGIGYFLFTRETNEAEEISISPEKRRDLS